MPELDVPAPVPTRSERRRAATRASLIEAAGALIARKGVDAVRINEITEEADVGFGSFYNHFGSKAEIVDAVVETVLSGQAETVRTLTAGLEDDAEVQSVVWRFYIDLARTDPVWGWLMVRLDLSHRIAPRVLGPYARRDLQRGIDSGRLDIPDLDATITAMFGAHLAVMRGVLDGTLGPDAVRVHTETTLRMLGLDKADAAAVAARPMPSA